MLFVLVWETWSSVAEPAAELFVSDTCAFKFKFCYILAICTDSLEIGMLISGFVLSGGIKPPELVKLVCDDIIVFRSFFNFYVVFEIESSTWMSCRFLATAV